LCAEGWKAGSVPAAAGRFDEKHTRIHTTPENIDGITFVRELDRFRRDDLDVGVDPSPITIRKELQ
jgi:hypothetical protein